MKLTALTLSAALTLAFAFSSSTAMAWAPAKKADRSNVQVRPAKRLSQHKHYVVGQHRNFVRYTPVDTAARQSYRHGVL